MRLPLLLALAVLVTKTAHAQFEIEESHTTAGLRGIHSLGGGVAWASGEHGTVLRTEDGGYLWQTCTTPPGAENLDFRGIQGFDADTAIVMSSGKGDLSRLYKTTDGCQSWKLVFTNPDQDGFWDAILFQRGSGWLLGDPVNGSISLFETNDFGRQWIRQLNRKLLVQPDTTVIFAASNSTLFQRFAWTAFVTGGTEGAAVFSGGATSVCVDDCSEEDQDRTGKRASWTRTAIPMGDKTDSSGAFSIAGQGCSSCPAGAYSLVAVGGDYKQPDGTQGTAVYRLADEKIWQPAHTSPHGYRSSVAYDAPTKTWITVGPNGTDVSRDDGRNWQPLRPSAQDAPDADKNWNALSLPFVVGPHGRIGKLRGDALTRKP